MIVVKEIRKIGKNATAIITVLTWMTIDGDLLIGFIATHTIGTWLNRRSYPLLKTALARFANRTCFKAGTCSTAG